MLKRISSSFNLVIQFQGPGSGGLGRSRRHQATRSPATQNKRGQTTPSPATRNRHGRSPEQPPEPGATTAETNRGKIDAFFYLLFRFRCGRECWKSARFFYRAGERTRIFLFYIFLPLTLPPSYSGLQVSFYMKKSNLCLMLKKVLYCNPLVTRQTR